MPVGVPKVPYQGPGDDEATWVDLYNRLYRERLLFLCQKVDNAVSNQLMGIMTYLHLEDPTKDIYLFINCPGGWILPGLALHDMMQVVKSDVQTICVGIAASMGSFILTAGEITKRTAFPHARVMMHQPMADLVEKSAMGEYVLELNEVGYIRDSIIDIYVQRTGQPGWIISEDLDRDIFMSAEEAQAHGIIDQIGMERE